jgi:hypothetical protein
MTLDESALDSLFIKELIRRVHEELLASRAERVGADQDPIFEVASLVLEVNFVVTESKEAKGGLDFKIITAGAGASYDRQQVHKVTLTLAAIPTPADGLVGLEVEDPARFRPRVD